MATPVQKASSHTPLIATVDGGGAARAVTMPTNAMAPQEVSNQPAKLLHGTP